MPKRILITGGAGFIGLNLIEYLKTSSDLEVIVLDNFFRGEQKGPPLDRVEVIVGDIRDSELLNRSCRNVDAVVHLAADTRVMDSIDNPRFNFQVNVEGSFNVLEACRQNGVARLIAASTGGAIIGEAMPPVHEEMVARPLAPYGASKLALEGYLHAYAKSYGMQCHALRFSNVYGPLSFHKGSVVAQFLRDISLHKKLVVYGDGSASRDFIHVHDICRAIALCLHKTDDRNSTYQIGTGAPTTIRALIGLMKNIVAPEYQVEVDYRPARPGEIRETYSDISLAREHLGFEPSVPLGQGLRATWTWYQEYFANGLALTS
jgi:UDP-glucose 4-epimerase